MVECLALGELKSVLDLGCGVGVLGLCLKKKNPHIGLHLTDRDALALAFTGYNSDLNKIDPVTITRGLGFSTLTEERFDLIAANLPAKAGNPVLQDIFFNFGGYLTEKGIFAFVIVEPLKKLADASLAETGAEIIFREKTKEHTAYLVRSGEKPADNAELLSPYIRSRVSFQTTGASYALNTVYNLPDFDTLGYETHLAMELLFDISLKGRVLFWNPGQGHIPVMVSKRADYKAIHFVLAGRDLLQLEATRKNLIYNGVPATGIDTRHAPVLNFLQDSFQAQVIFPDPDPGAAWPKTILSQCAGRLAENGFLLIVTKSVFANRLLLDKSPFRMVKSRKKRGFRAILLRKTHSQRYSPST